MVLQVRGQCKAWSSALSQGGYESDGLCIIHMGSHLLNVAPVEAPVSKPGRTSIGSRFMSSFNYGPKTGINASDDPKQPSLSRLDSTKLLLRVLEEKITSRLGGSWLDHKSLSSHLTEAQELVSIVPWPLRARQWCGASSPGAITEVKRSLRDDHGMRRQIRRSQGGGGGGGGGGGLQLSCLD